MRTNIIEKNYKEVLKQHKKLNIRINNLEKSLKDVIEFDFSIVEDTTDGYLIATDAFNLWDESVPNVILKDCLKVIKDKGSLSLEDYKSLWKGDKV